MGINKISQSGGQNHERRYGRGGRRHHAGDILHLAIPGEPRETFASHRISQTDKEVIGPVPRSVLEGADLTIGNMEAVIPEAFDCPNSDTPPLLMAPVETAEFLADNGFDVVHIDNNHILDYGEASVAETKEHLADVGIDYIGSPLGEERPTTVTCDGTEVHLAGFNLCSEGRTSEREDVLQAAEELASRPGVSMLSLHWGWRAVHTLSPSPTQVNFAREIVETGVDVVLGHHSHTFQPVEQHGHGAIAYSLDNFVFDMWLPENVESGVLKLTVDPS